MRELGRTVGGGDRTGLLHVSLLEGLAGGLLAEGVTVRQREAGRPVADFPAVRRQVCRLLGEAGTATAARLLAGALRADPDLTVRAAAARELGRAAAAPPAGLVALLLAELEAHPREGGYARELLAALAAALRGEPGPPDPDDLRALLRLSQGGLPRETRRVLGELLRELARRPPAAGP